MRPSTPSCSPRWASSRLMASNQTCRPPLLPVTDEARQTGMVAASQPDPGEALWRVLEETGQVGRVGNPSYSSTLVGRVGNPSYSLTLVGRVGNPSDIDLHAERAGGEL